MHVEFKENYEVKTHTSIKIGGKIRKVYFPKSVCEFEEILQKEDNVKVFGNFSNTIVSSDGYDGTIIITDYMNNNSYNPTDGSFYAECGCNGPLMSLLAKEAGLSGFEFMIGFPGSIGGNICMNASAHGQCISDKLVTAKCYSKETGIKEFSKNDMKFGYRTSICQQEPIFVLGGNFQLDKKPPLEIKLKMEENLAFRKNHQPSLNLPNFGSVFRNPENDSAGRLLDSIGAKNFSFGSVKVWENHANFIINPEQKGTSTDVLELMYKMFSSVKEKYGIELKPEVKYLGNNNKREAEICKILNIK